MPKNPTKARAAPKTPYGPTDDEPPAQVATSKADTSAPAFFDLSSFTGERSGTSAGTAIMAALVKVYPHGYALIFTCKIFNPMIQAILATKDFYQHTAPFPVGARVETADGVVSVDSSTCVFGTTVYSKILLLSKTKHAKTMINDAAHAVELFCQPLTAGGVTVAVSDKDEIYPASTVMSSRQLWKFFRTAGIPRSAINKSKHWVPDDVDGEAFLKTGEEQCSDYRAQRQAAESGASSSQSSSQGSDWSASSQSS